MSVKQAAKHLPLKIIPTGLHLGTQSIERIEITNSRGSTLSLLNYGATIARFELSLASGETRDVVLHCPEDIGYLNQRIYLGSTIGRYANRIADGKFTLTGRTFQTKQNERGNSLHGGLKGFDKRVWQIESTVDQQLTMRLHSADGDQGFPGDVNVQATFSLTDDNVIRVHYYGVASAPTPLNLTCHPYFNLARNHPTTSSHSLEIFADHYIPVNDRGIPNAKLTPVVGTGFDFREPQRIGDFLLSDTHQEITRGYDHSFTVQNCVSRKPIPMARLTSPRGDLQLTISSNMPAIQFYSGGGLAGASLADGDELDNYAAIALEPQFAPDSPNQSGWPSCIFGPDRPYEHIIEYRFDG